MKLLVLVADYPSNDGRPSLYYVHTRNKYYISRGIDVAVLNFAAKQNYIIDGIPVYTYESYEERLRNEKFDILVCHAANIRNHYMFLCKYQKLFPKIVFFFHGHEVLRRSKVYPRPYNYVKQDIFLKRFIQDWYDILKLYIWKRTLEKLAFKSWFIFVSQWMYEEFLKWVKIDSSVIKNHKRIIYNSIGSAFETEYYDKDAEKVYDFVTIRNNLDGAKYCIDIVTNLARRNPKYRFCVVGQGNFYKFNAKPDNLTLIEKYLNHAEIINLLNQSKCALMPTRTDAQGVMACEMATFGIPLITSDVPVCKEIFREFDNVAFINNDFSDIDITPIFEKITCTQKTYKNRKFFAENTCGKEVELFKRILEEAF
jgi:glycosyltransferase involved in cell wall biosynthesis